MAPKDEEHSMHLLFADVQIFASDDQQIAVIAAAITRRWLEKWVLPNQDVLSDAPHLALRMPWLVPNFQDENAWRKLESLEVGDGLIENLKEFKFQPSCLFSRPVYWTEAIETSGSKLRPENFDYSKIPDYVFREDVSNFGAPAESRDFPSQVISIENRRWITDPDRQPVIEGPQKIKAVVFEPQSLLLS